MIHQFNIKWDAAKDKFLNDLIRHGYDKLDYMNEYLLDSNLSEDERRPKNLAEFDECLKYIEIYDNIYRKDETEAERVERILTDNLKYISSIGRIIEQAYVKKMATFNPEDKMVSYLNIEPEHEPNEFAFFTLFNWYEENKLIHYVINKFLCFAGVSYVTANPLNFHFHSGSIRIRKARVINSFNSKAWEQIRNFQSEKNKLQFDIDISFNDETLDLILHVNHIAGPWAFKEMIETGRIINRIGKKIFFSPIFMTGKQAEGFLCNVIYF